MFYAKGVLHAGPGTAAFDIATLMWAVGGLTYGFLGFFLLSAERPSGRALSEHSGDSSDPSR
jgi:hypothetical protein